MGRAWAGGRPLRLRYRPGGRGPPAGSAAPGPGVRPSDGRKSSGSPGASDGAELPPSRGPLRPSPRRHRRLGLGLPEPPGTPASGRWGSPSPRRTRHPLRGPGTCHPGTGAVSVHLFSPDPRSPCGTPVCEPLHLTPRDGAPVSSPGGPDHPPHQPSGVTLCRWDLRPPICRRTSPPGVTPWLSPSSQVWGPRRRTLQAFSGRWGPCSVEQRVGW